VANRVTDVCGERIIHGITSEISRQRAGRVCALVNITWFDFNKGGCFIWKNVSDPLLEMRADYTTPVYYHSKTFSVSIDWDY